MHCSALGRYAPGSFLGNRCDHNIEHTMHYASASVLAHFANELTLSAMCHATMPVLQASRIFHLL